MDDSAHESFAARVDRIRTDVVEQGARVLAQLETSFDAMFLGSVDRARDVIDRDDEVDDHDLRIETAAISCLSDATREGFELMPEQLRCLLALVKVNNDLERIGDCAVEVAERAIGIARAASVGAERPAEIDWPTTARVMTNSVIGIVRDAVAAIEQRSEELARIVLRSEHTVLEFRRAIVRKAEERLADGRIGIEIAFNIGDVAGTCSVVADHCCNIAENVIFECTGHIVRHSDLAAMRPPLRRE